MSKHLSNNGHFGGEGGGHADKGPQKQDYDLGYKNSPKGYEGSYYPGDMRGNDYMKMQREMIGRDNKKLRANKFTKIA